MATGRWDNNAGVDGLALNSVAGAMARVIAEERGNEYGGEDQIPLVNLADSYYQSLSVRRRVSEGVSVRSSSSITLGNGCISFWGAVGAIEQLDERRGWVYETMYTELGELLEDCDQRRCNL